MLATPGPGQRRARLASRSAANNRPLSRSALSLSILVIICSHPSLSRTADEIVIVYGDSLWDVGQRLNRCDLCPFLDPRFEIRNFAQAGAEIWHQDRCGPEFTPEPDCRNGIDRAIPCSSMVETETTCIESNRRAAVLLLQFGTNDVRQAGLDESLWVGRDRPRFQASLQAILAEKPSNMACILVVPPPIWSSSYSVFNLRLRQVRTILFQHAELFDCVVADLFSAYLTVEAERGEGATLPLYKDCFARGAGSDCVHYSIPRPRLPASIINSSLEDAIRIPETRGPLLPFIAIAAALLTALIRTRMAHGIARAKPRAVGMPPEI